MRHLSGGIADLVWRAVSTLGLAAIAAACASPSVVTDLPAPVISGAIAGGVSRAGFGRADITPTPGVGLNGNGFEGRQAVGFRQRLNARAMVLETGNGQRVAIITADLAHVSPVLQRLTAARVEHHGLGTDRIFLAATHSHAGPGNYYEVVQYNLQSSALPGYDSAMVRFLVRRFELAIDRAIADLAPARMAWGNRKVNRLTRNRSLEAFRRNEGLTSSQAGDSVDGVDQDLLMLRIDRCGPGPACRPRGAFSIFAIHGTGNAPGNDLLDADIHGIVAWGLERHMDQAGGDGAVHLFANGAEGDVSPNLPPSTRCNLLSFRRGRRPSGARTPPAPEEWRAPAGKLEQCVAATRKASDELGTRLTDEAQSLYDQLGTQLETGLPLERAFTTVRLDTLGGAYPLCPKPRSGVANAAGAEDGRTRIYRWRFFGLIASGIEEGGRAVQSPPRGCQGAKRILLGRLLQGIIVGEHGLPAQAQLAVLRIGSTWLGVVPAELTTEAGMRAKRAIRAAAGTAAQRVAILGLTNGYLQYVSTPEEYSAQHYEGGATLFGPNTAPAIAEILRGLTQSMMNGGPRVEVSAITSRPGPATTYLRPPESGPSPGGLTRVIESVQCTEGHIRLRWLDVYPGQLMADEAPFLTIAATSDSGGVLVLARDGDPTVEVRARGPRGRGYRWQAEWKPARMEARRYRITLVPRGDLPQLETVVICQ